MRTRNPIHKTAPDSVKAVDGYQQLNLWWKAVVEKACQAFRASFTNTSQIAGLL